jgi:hypothetical protein
MRLGRQKKTKMKYRLICRNAQFAGHGLAARPVIGKTVPISGSNSLPFDVVSG